MTLTDIELCSLSLIKIGASPIASFDDDTAEAEVAKTLYGPTLEGLLVAHPWAFSLTQADLQPAAVNSFQGYANAYELPANALRTISASGPSGRNCVYRVIGQMIVSDADTLSLTYQHRPASSAFPPHFIQTLTARLAAEFCLPLTESASRSDVLQKLAVVELRLARLIDSQQATSKAVEDFTLIEVRG